MRHVALLVIAGNDQVRAWHSSHRGDQPVKALFPVDPAKTKHPGLRQLIYWTGAVEGSRAGWKLDPVRNDSDAARTQSKPADAFGLDLRSYVNRRSRSQVATFEQPNPPGFDKIAFTIDQLGNEHTSRREDIRHTP